MAIDDILNECNVYLQLNGIIESIVLFVWFIFSLPDWKYVYFTIIWKHLKWHLRASGNKCIPLCQYLFIFNVEDFLHYFLITGFHLNEYVFLFVLQSSEENMSSQVSLFWKIEHTDIISLTRSVKCVWIHLIKCLLFSEFRVWITRIHRVTRVHIRGHSELNWHLKNLLIYI